MCQLLSLLRATLSSLSSSLFVFRAQGSALLAYQDQPGYAKEINALLTNPALRTNAVALAHSCRQRGDPDAKGYIRAAVISILG